MDIIILNQVCIILIYIIYYLLLIYIKFLGINILQIYPTRESIVVPLHDRPAPMAERSEAQSCSLADDCSSITVP